MCYYRRILVSCIIPSLFLNLVCLLSELDICLWSAKPGFFHEESRVNLFEVELKSGMLINTDNGTPMAQVRLRELWHSYSLSHATYPNVATYSFFMLDRLEILRQKFQWRVKTKRVEFSKVGMLVIFTVCSPSSQVHRYCHTINLYSNWMYRAMSHLSVPYSILLGPLRWRSHIRWHLAQQKSTR